jgi:hypothetical protein
MQEVNRIVIAHRNQGIINTLIEHIALKYHITPKVTNDGFIALRNILKLSPELVIIEADLPNLNATDIIRCINKKGLRTTFIVIIPDMSTKVPCASETKNMKTLPCHTKVIKTTYKPDNLYPLLKLIDQVQTKQRKISY